MYKPNTLVKFSREYEQDIFATQPDIRGTIVGYGTMNYTNHEGKESMESVYIVKLEQGFYSPDNRQYINTVTVHPDNLTVDPIN